MRHRMSRRALAATAVSVTLAATGALAGTQAPAALAKAAPAVSSEKGVDPDPAENIDPSTGDGAGDMDADYGKDFTAAQAVNGQADTYGQLAGNFHQLQELSWTQLKVSFTTGSSGTVTVYIHGWYSQGNVYADDFSVG